MGLGASQPFGIDPLKLFSTDGILLFFGLTALPHFLVPNLKNEIATSLVNAEYLLHRDIVYLLRILISVRERIVSSHQWTSPGSF